jgi:hypothetical protein
MWKGQMRTERKASTVDMKAHYQHNPNHPARLNKNGRPEPTRQPRHDNRLYCMVWPDHQLIKVGLSSGRNKRDASAVVAITKYLVHDGVIPGRFTEWRAQIPELDGAAWGDCQRLEMVFATSLKRRLGASAAGAVGLEWLTRDAVGLVSWIDELIPAAVEALTFAGLDGPVDWIEYTPRPVTQARVDNPRIHGASQRDAWRTMRNRHGECAMRGCGVGINAGAVQNDRFRYCSDAHAVKDATERSRWG